MNSAGEQRIAAWNLADAWVARLEVVEQLRIQFVRLQKLRRLVGRRATRIWDLAERIRRLAEKLEEDA